MKQISKIHFTPEGEISNYFNFLKKFETGTVRPTKISKEKNQCSRLTTFPPFTILQKAFKLKFAPLFAPLTNLLKQT